MSKQKQVINEQQKSRIDEIVKRVETKYNQLYQLLRDSHTHQVYLQDGDKNYQLDAREYKKLLDEDIRMIKALPKTFRDIASGVRTANKSTTAKNKPTNGFSRPFKYTDNVADFFFKCFLMTADLEQILSKEEMDEIPDRLNYLLNFNVSNSGILSQLFYGYRRCIPGVIDTRDGCSSFIYSDKGILEFFKEELDSIVNEGRFEDFDVQRFNLQRINSVFSRATIKSENQDSICKALKITPEQLSEQLESEMEYARNLRIRINDYHEKSVVEASERRRETIENELRRT